MDKSDTFLEERIRWRAGLHELKASSTMYWEDAPENYREKLPKELGNAVVLSFEDPDNFTIVCTRGVLGKNEGEDRTFLHSQIRDISGPKLTTKELPKSEANYFSVDLVSTVSVTVKAEKGSPLFMVWNVVLMLHRMS